MNRYASYLSLCRYSGYSHDALMHLCCVAAALCEQIDASTVHAAYTMFCDALEAWQQSGARSPAFWKKCITCCMTGNRVIWLVFELSCMDLLVCFMLCWGYFMQGGCGSYIDGLCGQDTCVVLCSNLGN